MPFTCQETVSKEEVGRQAHWRCIPVGPIPGIGDPLRHIFLGDQDINGKPGPQALSSASRAASSANFRAASSFALCTRSACSTSARCRYMSSITRCHGRRPVARLVSGDGGIKEGVELKGCAR